MRVIVKLIIWTLLRVRLRGDLSPLTAGKVLVIANHDSLLDGPLLGLFLPPRAWVVMSSEDMAFAPNRFLARFFRHCVLDLSQPATVRYVVRLLAAGELVVMFPQGRVTTTASAMKLYHSVATIAVRSGARIVPIYVDGLLYSKYSHTPGDFSRRWLPQVTLRVYGVTYLPEYAGTETRAKRRKAADALAAILQCAQVDARERQTIYEAFLGAVKIFGRRYRLLEDVRGKHESYGDLLKATVALARLASRIGAEREIVGVMMPNISTTVCLLLGMGAAGRVPAMLNYSSGPQALRNACVAAGIHTVITSRRFIAMAVLYPALGALYDRRIVFIEDLRQQFGLLDKFWLIAWGLRRPRCVLRVPDPAVAAVVLFTSGSETRPKGVALSHDALLANIAQSRAVLGFSPTDRLLNALPMFHTYGLTGCTLLPLMCGAGIYLYTSPLRYRVIPELAYMRDCTILVGTSTFLSHYARAAHPYDFYRVRYVISGGEKLTTEVRELWFEKFGLRIFEGYGATECGPVLAFNAPLAYKVQTVGRLMPRIEYQLFPVEGIMRGGRLHVRGPNLMLGYYLYDLPGALQPPQSDAGVGWYDTGDVVDIDTDGYVTVLGRVKRFAKIAGEMIALETVERIAYHASSQHRHAATVEMVAGTGESTVLFTTNPDLTRALLHRAAKLLGSHDLAVARRIVHVAELPLLGGGKTDYVTLNTLLAETPRPRVVGGQ